MEIRKMLPEDIPRAAALEAACFGADAWSGQALEQALSDKNALYLSCIQEGRLIACCGIWQSLEDGDITNVAVEEGSRRKGCARRLLLELMRRAALRGVENFTLEVRESNIPAVRLYESLGFAVEGVRKNFYREPAENALIMWKR